MRLREAGGRFVVQRVVLSHGDHVRHTGSYERGSSRLPTRRVDDGNSQTRVGVFTRALHLR